ncbi:hypothetical protein CWE09_12315 [Aliidiomarina minuta]|uniref:EAL domain-containing protein n=1 Tax=Aliidiomarina minuta TaxID=880057 RepID=A0A432W3P9_9GAMM|nr:EAL domain-containing protein [Aliidiomarina minuta]RUO23926.1 hypothetical protein CWE09_12315 [Aliidiomarina minuta]
MLRIINVFFLLTLSFQALPNQVLQVTEEQPRIEIAPQLHQWRETETVTINNLELLATQTWERVGSGTNKGYIEDAYWYRVDLRNAQDTPQIRYLELAYPLIDYVDVYIVERNNVGVNYPQPLAHFATGDNRAFSSRPIQSRTFVFPLNLSAQGDYRIYLRAHSAGAHQIPLRLWTSEAYIQYSNNDATIRAIYYGSQLMLIVFMLGLCMLMRERVYLYFSASLIGLLTLQASLHGVIFQYIVPDFPRLNEYIVLMSVPFTLAVMTLFTSDYLQLRQKSLRWYRLLKIATWVSLAALLAIFLLPYQSATVLGLGLSVPVSVMMISAGLASWSLGTKTARLFTISWVVLLTGCLVLIVSQLGAGSLPQVSQYAVPVASSIQTLLLAYALADRFQQDRNEKVKAQDARIEVLQQQRDIQRDLVLSASRNQVTGLCNRQIFEHALHKFLSADSGKTAAIALFHLTGVGDLNKTLGHENSDDLIKQLATRLNLAAREIPGIIALDRQDEIMVSNIETTTFGCIVQNLDQSELVTRATQLRDILQQPIGCMGLSIEMSVQTGCAIAKKNSDVSVLLRQAFIAFDQVLPHDNHIMLYDQGMDAYSPRRLTLMTELKQSLHNNELELYFQPQVDLKTNKVIGLEALARWTHPEFGFVPPDEFIPIAERTGQIRALTSWVIKSALAFNSQLRSANIDINMSVNVSAEDLNDTSFPGQVAIMLEESQVLAQNLTLEVTETAAMRNPEVAVNALTALSKLGVRISIDDFGSGYSSLTYLRRLPAHEVKIDRSFVLEAHQSSDAETIIRTIINMSHELGFKVVGEGVENQAMVALLKTRGCDYGQGYYFARPLPENQVVDWLEQY